MQKVETKMLTHPNATCVGCFVVSSASREPRPASCPVIKVISCRKPRNITSQTFYISPDARRSRRIKFITTRFFSREEKSLSR